METREEDVNMKLDFCSCVFENTPYTYYIKTNKRSFSFASLDITFSSFLSSEEIKTSKENWKHKIATDNEKENKLKII